MHLKSWKDTQLIKMRANNSLWLPKLPLQGESASLYITHLQLSSIFEVFALPVTSVFKYVSFVSTVRTAESTVDLN